MTSNNISAQPQGAYRPLAPQRVIVGPDQLDNVGAEVDLLQAKNVFIITSPSCANRTPLLDQIKASLGDRLKGVFQGVAPHTPIPTIMEAAQQARDISADCLISLGGGSAIDTTKAVAFVLGLDIEEASELNPHLIQFSGGQVPPVPNMKKQLLHITIPTTGSAAECSGMVGVTDPVRERKYLIVAPAVLTPNVIILDPKAPLHTPQDLWLSSLVRSVDHAIEGSYTLVGNPHTFMLAEEGARLLFKYLPKCKEDPNDLEARGSLQVAAWHTGWAVVGSGAGLSHGIGYVLGGTYDIPHGICSCVMLPSVMEWNMESCIGPLARVARAIGAATEDEDDHQAAPKSIQALRDLLEKLELPSRLSELNGAIKEEDFDHIADLTLDLPHMKTNPRVAQGKEDILEILNLAW